MGSPFLLEWIPVNVGVPSIQSLVWMWSTIHSWINRNANISRSLDNVHHNQLIIISRKLKLLPHWHTWIEVCYTHIPAIELSYEMSYFVGLNNEMMKSIISRLLRAEASMQIHFTDSKIFTFIIRITKLKSLIIKHKKYECERNKQCRNTICNTEHWYKYMLDVYLHECFIQSDFF